MKKRDVESFETHYEIGLCVNGMEIHLDGRLALWTRLVSIFKLSRPEHLVLLATQPLTTSPSSSGNDFIVRMSTKADNHNLLANAWFHSHFPFAPLHRTNYLSHHPSNPRLNESETARR
jgi:hypothetical protein